MDTTVLLIRHGITDWTAEGRIHGQLDVGLNAAGIDQAQALGVALKDVPIAELVASPQLRAVQTAEILAGFLDHEVARDPRLQELRAGEWEGRVADEVVRTGAYRRFLEDPMVRSPGGESLAELRDRAVAAVAQVCADNEIGATVALVTHGGVIRAILAHYLGTPLGQPRRFRICPGSVTALRFSDDRSPPRLLALNHGATIALLLAR